MPQETKTFRVLVSSPSDLSHERQIVKAAVTSASRILTGRGLRLEPWLWEEDTISSFGATAQVVINEQLGDYDFYTGMMGAAFGSPTEKFGSGTEEEFIAAISAFKAGKLKKVGFFFKDVSIDTGKLNSFSASQLQKVTQFKESATHLGLYSQFKDDAELTVKLTEFLVKSFDDYSSSGEPENSSGPNTRDLSTTNYPISPTFTREVLSLIEKEITAGDTSITLDDLRIDLDFRATLLIDREITVRIYSPASILEDMGKGRSFHICGKDVSGKSSTCKTLFVGAHRLKFHPVLISGKDIRSADFERLHNRIRTRICEQYDGVSQEQAHIIPSERIIVIIDDFDLVTLPSRISLELMSELERRFFSVVITTSVSFSYAVLETTDEVSAFSQFTRVEIQEVGQKKRYQLIENWYRATTQYQDENRFRYKIEQARLEINRILITHVVPRTPLIVLILLQALDNGQSADLAQSGYVRYYKFLIDTAILRNLRIDEAELAYALLPQLAWAVYKTEEKNLSPEDADQIVEEFANRRALKRSSLYSVLEKLKDIGMFYKDVENYRFRHLYAYNFFLAEYLSQTIETTATRDLIQRICSGVWSKDQANILVFVSFHSNNSIITESLIKQLEGSYKEAAEFDFETNSTELINKLILVAPKQILDHAKSKEGRESRLDAQDKAEPPSDDEKQRDQDRPLGEMESVLMAVEVLGHILRNHYARLDAAPKQRMFEAAASAVLRCAGSFISMLSENIDVLVSYTKSAVSKLRIQDDGDDDKVESFARAMVFLLAMGFLYHCARKFSQAVGDENLEITFSQSISSDSRSIKRFLDIIIKLDCFEAFPARDLNDLVKILKKNHLATTILRAAVSERLDLRPPNTHADFQRYCRIVGLETVPRLLERQRLGSKSDFQG